MYFHIREILDAEIIMADNSNSYHYSPSAAAAIIFLVSFTITTSWHILITVRRRIWYFIPLVCGGVRMSSNTIPLDLVDMMANDDLNS